MLSTALLDPNKLPQHVAILAHTSAGKEQIKQPYLEICETLAEVRVPFLTFFTSKESTDEVQAALENFKAAPQVLICSESGRDAVVRMLQQLAFKIRKGLLLPTAINTSLIESTLGPWPPLDLVICTGGRQNLEGSLVWESAYSEFYFCEQDAWNLSRKNILEALFSFQKRDRRFGKVKTISQAG